MSGFSFADLQKVADDAGFKLLEPAEYEVAVDKVEHKLTRTDKDMFNVTFKVVEGPHAGKGRVFNNFVISPESPVALGFFFREMDAMGLDRDYFAALPQGEAGMKRVEHDLVGKRCRVKVIMGEYNGNEKNEVDKVMKPKSDTTAPAPRVQPPGGPSVPQVTPSSNGNGVPQVSVPPTAAPPEDVF